MQTIVTPALLHKEYLGGGGGGVGYVTLALFLGFLLGTRDANHSDTCLTTQSFWGGGGYVQARDQPLACFLGFLLGTSGTSGRKPGNETTLRLTLVSHPQSTMQCDCTSGGHG